jgi:APA family basic amino acid/polyamine antiporter
VPDARLLRVLGVGFGLAVTIGNTIGAGIFRAPGEVARHLQEPWLILAAWAAGGLYAWLGALQIAELGAMLPRAGGQYVFARHAFGHYAGFIVGWSDWISTCGTTAAVALIVAEFSGALFPPAVAAMPLVAAGVTAAFAVAQWRGIRAGSVVQQVTSLAKALAFAALVAAAFVWGGRPPPGAAEALAAPAGLALAAAFVLALQSVIYTYDGWTGPVYFAEEMKDPASQVPRALLGGVLAITAIYMLFNVALLYALSPSQVIGNAFAAGTLAETLVGGRGDTLFRALTIVSMLSAINAYHLMASRVLFAMSRDGLFPAGAQATNAGGTPTVALLLSAGVAILFVFVGRTFDKVITVLAFFFVANYTLSFLAVFVLRRREPERPRPYRAWGYPWTTAAALLGSVAFLAGAVVSDTRNSVYAMLLLAASYPIYRVKKQGGMGL